MSNPRLRSILEMNKQTLKNLDTLQKHYDELGPDGLPTSTSSLLNRKVQLVSTSLEAQDEYRQEVYQYLYQYIVDDDIVTRLTQNELSDAIIRELAINWKPKYESRVDTLAGQNLSLAKFVDFLKDIVAESLNAKGSKNQNDIKIDKSDIKKDNSDSDLPDLEEVYPDEDIPTADVEIVDPSVTRMVYIRNQYFHNNLNGKITSSIELPKAIEESIKRCTNEMNLRKAKEIIFNDNTSLEIKTKLINYFDNYLPIFDRSTIVDYLLKAFSSYTDVKFSAMVKTFWSQKEVLFTSFFNSLNNNQQTIILSQKYELSLRDFAPASFITKDNKVLLNKALNDKLTACSNLVLTLIYFDIESETNILQQTIKGSGLQRTHSLKKYHQPMHKYYIDKNKLNDGILEIRYQANKHIANVKPQTISPQFAIVLSQMMKAGDVDMKDFALLTTEEKVLTKKLIKMFQLDISLLDNKQLLKSQFEVLQAEQDAGNNSEMLQSKISDYQRLMNS